MEKDWEEMREINTDVNFDKNNFILSFNSITCRREDFYWPTYQLGHEGVARGPGRVQDLDMSRTCPGHVQAYQMQEDLLPTLITTVITCY